MLSILSLICFLSCLLINQPINATKLNHPMGVALNSLGQVVIADTHYGRIIILALNGSVVSQIGLAQVTSVAVDVDDVIYATDASMNRVMVYTPEGQQLAAFDNLGLSDPSDIAVDPEGQMYIADPGNNRILVISPSGSILSSFDGSKHVFDHASPSFSGPRGVAVGSDGSIYVADTGNNRVVVLNSKGEQERVIQSGMNFPTGITLNAAGNLLISDTANNRILLFDVHGDASEVLTCKGFNHPIGSVVDLAGQILVADSGNHQIQVITHRTQTRYRRMEPYLHVTHADDTCGEFTQ